MNDFEKGEVGSCSSSSSPTEQQLLLLLLPLLVPQFDHSGVDSHVVGKVSSNAFASGQPILVPSPEVAVIKFEFQSRSRLRDE